MLTPRKQRWFRAIAVVVGVALAIFVMELSAEIALSWEKKKFKPVMPDEVKASVNRGDHHIPTVPDPYLGYRMRPGLDSETVKTNAHGLRAGPVAASPAENTVRVLLLGGSVAWGYESNSNDDTISAYLEAELERRLPGAGAFEVLNGGVPAYVAWQEALAYARDHRHLSPDWVITLDGANDVESAILNGEPGVPMRYRAVRGAYLDPGVPPSPIAAIVPWVASGVRELRAYRAYEKLWPRTVDGHHPAPVEDVASQIAAAASFLSTTAAPLGARVLTVLQPMVILPDTKPLSPFEEQIVVEHDRRMPGRNAYYEQSFAAIRTALADLARESAPRYRFLDATDAFRDVADVTYTDHCHLTPIGRKALAARIADALAPAIEADRAGRTAD